MIIEITHKTESLSGLRYFSDYVLRNLAAQNMCLDKGRGIRRQLDQLDISLVITPAGTQPVTGEESR